MDAARPAVLPDARAEPSADRDMAEPPGAGADERQRAGEPAVNIAALGQAAAGGSEAVARHELDGAATGFSGGRNATHGMAIENAAGQAGSQHLSGNAQGAHNGAADGARAAAAVAGRSGFAGACADAGRGADHAAAGDAELNRSTAGERAARPGAFES